MNHKRVGIRVYYEQFKPRKGESMKRRQMKSLVLSIVFTALAVGASAATDDDFWDFATAYKEPKPVEESAVTTSLLDSFAFLSRGIALAVDFCSNPPGSVLIFR